MSRFQPTWNLPAMSRNSAPRIPLVSEQQMLSSERNQTLPRAREHHYFPRSPQTSGLEQGLGRAWGHTEGKGRGVLQPQQAPGWVLDSGYHFVVMRTWAISLTLTSYLSVKVSDTESVFSNTQGAREIQRRVPVFKMMSRNPACRACSTG